MGLYGMMRTGVSGMAAPGQSSGNSGRQHRQFEHHRLQAGLHGILFPHHSRDAGQLQFGRREDECPLRDLPAGAASVHCLLERSRHQW